MAAATMFLLTALKGGRVDSVLGEGSAAALGKAGQAGLLQSDGDITRSENSKRAAIEAAAAAKRKCETCHRDITRHLM